MAYQTNTAQILAWLYPDLDNSVDYRVVSRNGVTSLEWYTVAYAKPTEADIAAQEKPWAASVKRAEINEQQELRSVTVVGFRMPQPAFALMEELYVNILLPSSRKAITESDTPLWYGLKQLRDERNQLLAALNGAVACESITAEQILNFDVTRGPTTLTFCGTQYTWSGWSYGLP